MCLWRWSGLQCSISRMMSVVGLILSECDGVGVPVAWAAALPDHLSLHDRNSNFFLCTFNE